MTAGFGAGGMGRLYGFALIATLPLFFVRALVGRNRGPLMALLVGGGVGLLYGLVFHRVFELFVPITAQPVVVAGWLWPLAGAIGGLVWRGMEWVLR